MAVYYTRYYHRRAEARQFNVRSYNNQKAVADWCGGTLQEFFNQPEESLIFMPKGESFISAKFGDWIVKFDAEISIVSDDTFDDLFYLADTALAPSGGNDDDICSACEG